MASFAWPLLIQAGGLATLDGGRLQLAVIECADPALVAIITHDRVVLRTLCHPIGDRHLAVPLEQELKLRKAVPAAFQRCRHVGDHLNSAYLVRDEVPVDGGHPTWCRRVRLAGVTESGFVHVQHGCWSRR
jgi:hypothetical protein